MGHRTKKILWIGAGLLAVVALGTAYWVHRFKSYTPPEVLQDIRAGIAARNDPRPVDRFMEERYGPMTDPANRQRAFLDFFNPGHVEGLHVLVSRMPRERRQREIMSMAKWIADYRRTMTPEEKRDLGKRLDSEEGRAMMRQATAQYLRQGVHYRGSTAPVIEELMTTVTTVQQR
jgi:hypothetical protein